MTTNEEKIFNYCNDLVAYIDEKSYLMDKEFEKSNCNYILYIIGKQFIEKGIINLFSEYIKIYIDRCLIKSNNFSKYDYNILYNNLDLLLVDGIITEQDVFNIKNKIDSYLFDKMDKNNIEEEFKKSKILINCSVL